ncbi:MAG TPA: AAA family ATPase [Pseudonocardia sp.]|nr:AAA family ATPase [Pseudonocardia sp.]
MPWPLVGRSTELEHLARLVADSECRGVVIAGPAGTGKTRLAEECLALAEPAGMATARVMASHAVRDVPFGALAPLLPPGQAGGSRAAEDRENLLRVAAGAVAGAGAGSRLMLLVDDAHLLDDLSATVVHQLAATTGSFVLATVRAGEQAPTPVTALWKDGLVERIELEGLTSAAIEELLAEVLGGHVDPGAATVLAQRSRGNVLYMRELVLGATRDGTLCRRDGLWRVEGPLSPSDRLVELVEARLEGLGPAERTLLEVVSFGEPLGAAELAALSDATTAESLERKALITSSMDGRRLRLRLAHPLYGDVVRARIPATRARAIARSLAETVEATGARRRGDTLRVARWRLTGGGGSGALMLEAATMARWHYDWDLAEQLARAAGQAGGGFEADLLMAQLASLQGRTADAESLLGRLSEQARDDDQLSRVTTSRLDNLLFSVRPTDGLRVAEQAEAAIGDVTLRDEIAARRAWVLATVEGPSAGIELAEELVGRSSGRALAWACLGAGYCLTRMGRIEDALAVSARGYATHLDLPTPLEWYPWWHLFVRCEALTYAGRLAEAYSLAVEQHERALAEGSPEAQAYFARQLSRVTRERGRVTASATHAREAVALFRRLDRPMFVRDGLQDLALAAGLAGDAAEAEAAISELDALGLSPYMHTAVEQVQAKGWASVAAGNLAGARELFEQAARLGERIGDLVSAVEALHALARLGRAKSVAGRLSELAAGIGGELPAARAAHTSALAGDDATRLEAVSALFESMGADLLAAEAAADAAVSWRRDHDRRREAAANRRARSLLDRCQGASTPALQSVTARAVLAPAERDAAVLAAAGASNKEIAGQLGVAVRSVENRLQHVYEKLGVTGRSELAAALGDLL